LRANCHSNPAPTVQPVASPDEVEMTAAGGKQAEQVNDDPTLVSPYASPVVA